MERVRDALLFLYFRGGADLALRNPIALAGLVGLVTHRSWSSAAVFLISVLVAYFIPNELLFRDSARTKREVLSFLKTYEGATFVRIPADDFGRHFDLRFLIPSFFGKRWLAVRMARRIRVFTVKSGAAGRSGPTAPRAYVSAIALDAYVFLRDQIANARPEVHFRLAHELGHASGIYTATAQRNLIGLTCVYFSIAWILVNAAWSWWLAAWTLVQLLACAIVARVFEAYRRDEHFHAELVADYMASRHLAPHEVRELLETGLAHALVQADPGLDAAQTANRKRILVERLESLGRGEEVDIPLAYLNYSFHHPLALALFVFLHCGYIVTFSAINTPSIVIAAAFFAPLFVYFMMSVRQDVELMIAINRILEPENQRAEVSGQA